MALIRSGTNFIFTKKETYIPRGIKRKRFLYSRVQKFYERHPNGVSLAGGANGGFKTIPRTWHCCLRYIEKTKEETIIDIVKNYARERVKNRLKGRRRRARRHMYAFAYKWFMTVTQAAIDDDLNPNADYIDVVCARLKAERIAFICFTERQKNGALHWHLLLEDKPSFYDKHTYDQVRKTTIYYSSEVNRDCGRNEIVALDDFFTPQYVKTVNYISKYVTKEDFPVRYSKGMRPKLNIEHLFERNTRECYYETDVKKNKYGKLVAVPVRRISIDLKLYFDFVSNEEMELLSMLHWQKSVAEFETKKYKVRKRVVHTAPQYEQMRMQL